MTYRNLGRQLRRNAGALAVLAALPLAACNLDKFLNLTDPDIINPSDLASPAGAEAERIGALSRLNQATSGAESFVLYGGLLGDEWRSGDTFIQRNETDQRAVATNNANIETALRILNRARVSAFEAHEGLKKYAPDAPPSEIAEMYVVEAFTENMLAENFCNGIPLSYVLEGGVQITGSPLTNAEVYALALAHYDTALIYLGAAGGPNDDAVIRYRAQVGRGRILLNQAKYPEAAAAVAGVPTNFAWQMEHTQTTRDNQTWALNISGRRYTVTESEGPMALNFQTANDPRVPVCRGGSAACAGISPTSTNPTSFDASTPLWLQKVWPTRSTPVVIASGVEARLIEAEAQVQAGDPLYLVTLNTLRTLPVAQDATRGTPLTPLVDPVTPAARQDQLFRERAFWLFSTGHRLGDMRRLLRAPYGRTQAAVFPNGAFFKGGNYGPDVNFPVSQAEENNPDFHGCIDRNP
jgi:hypothetical protein